MYKKSESKKGQLKSVFVTIIVAILVLGSILYVIVSMASKSDAATTHTLCRASIILRGKATLTLVKGVADIEKITPWICKTEDLGTISGKREEIKKEIANKMAMCWWEFAEGSVEDVFKVDRKEKACFVCYTFNIDDGLDKGVSSSLNVMAEPTLDQRAKNSISSQEMNNFLFSQAYNPGIIYGGGTKNYVGLEYAHDIDVGIADPIIFKQNKLKSTLVSGYVMDYAYRMDPDNKQKINDIGVKLQEKGLTNLLVLTAEEFNSMEMSDAREVVENTNLNSNSTSYDGLLVMLDYSKKKIRIEMGADLTLFVKEYDLNDILEKEFKKAQDTQCNDDACRIKAINDATYRTINAISEKLQNTQNNLQGISPKAYYYYLSNAGTSWPIITDIESQKTYVIAYVAVSDEFSTGSSLLRKAWNLNAKTAGLNLLTNGWWSDKLSADINVDRPQGLLIADVNSIGNECAMVKQ